jgi:hypothetical protein
MHNAHVIDYYRQQCRHLFNLSNLGFPGMQTKLWFALCALRYEAEWVPA